MNCIACGLEHPGKITGGTLGRRRLRACSKAIMAAKRIRKRQENWSPAATEAGRCRCGAWLTKNHKRTCKMRRVDG